MIVANIINRQKGPLLRPNQAGNAVEFGVEIPGLHHRHTDALRHGGGIRHFHQLVAGHNAGGAHNHLAVQRGSVLHRDAHPQVIVTGFQFQIAPDGNPGLHAAGNTDRTQNLGRVFRECNRTLGEFRFSPPRTTVTDSMSASLAVPENPD